MMVDLLEGSGDLLHVLGRSQKEPVLQPDRFMAKPLAEAELLASEAPKRAPPNVTWANGVSFSPRAENRGPTVKT